MPPASAAQAGGVRPRYGSVEAQVGQAFAAWPNGTVDRLAPARRPLPEERRSSSSSLGLAVYWSGLPGAEEAWRAGGRARARTRRTRSRPGTSSIPQYAQDLPIFVTVARPARRGSRRSRRRRSSQLLRRGRRAGRRRRPAPLRRRAAAARHAALGASASSTGRPRGAPATPRRRSRLRSAGSTRPTRGCVLAPRAADAALPRALRPCGSTSACSCSGSAR